MKNSKKIIAFTIVVLFICVIMYVIYNKKYEFFDSQPSPSPSPNETSNPNPTQTIKAMIVPTKTPEIPVGFSQDSENSLQHELVDNIKSNLYDVQNTINPTMTATMTPIPPVIFNDIKKSSTSNDMVDKTIQSALLPAPTPFPTLTTMTNIPTSVPTNNFSMPFDTSLHTSQYTAMDHNQGYRFGVTQKNFGLDASGDL